jgi:hypothetical protein
LYSDTNLNTSGVPHFAKQSLFKWNRNAAECIVLMNAVGYECQFTGTLGTGMECTETRGHQVGTTLAASTTRRPHTTATMSRGLMCFTWLATLRPVLASHSQSFLPLWDGFRFDVFYMAGNIKAGSCFPIFPATVVV